MTRAVDGTRPSASADGGLRPALPMVALLGVAIAWLVTSAWLLTSGSDMATPRLWVTDLMPLVLDLVAAAFVINAARQASTRRSGMPWLLIGIATLVVALADGLFAWFQLVLGVDPSPTFADVAYVGYYPLMVLALLSFPAVATNRAERRRLVSDSLIFVVGGGMVVWQSVLQTTLQSIDGDPAAAILAVAYPIGDLVLLFGVAGIALRRLMAVESRALVALVAGLCLVLFADVGFAIESLENGVAWPDVLYLASPVAIAAAGYFQTHSQRGARGSSVAASIPRPILYLPYFALTAGYTTLVIAALSNAPDLTALIVGAIVLTGLVLVRQEMLLRENSRLISDQTRRDSEARFRRLAGDSSDAITLVDAAGVVSDAANAVHHVLGLEAGKLVGRSIIGLAHVDDASNLAALINDTAARRPGTGRVEWRVWDGDGAWRQVETVAANLIDDPTIGRIVLTTRDVRERKILEQRLRQVSQHDLLTGLPNRAAFLARVHDAQESRGPGKSTTVIVVNIDGFKRLNDAIGHAAGDLVLQEVANRLTATLRSGDMCGRTGGDEFGILLGDADGAADAVAAAERFATTLQQPVVLGAVTTRISVHVGIAASSDAGEGPSSLVRHAELATSYARAEGRTGVAVFKPAMRAEVENRFDLESELRRAITGNELVLQYQPIIDLGTGDVAAAEALVRWNHPTRGPLAPSVFITVAEESGLIGELGTWVLKTACLEVARWARIAYGRVPRVAVNLSPQQVADSNLPWMIQEALARAGATPDWLSLEVTESQLIEDTEAVLERLSAIRSLGISIAIDDFGTGFSSLAYLQRFPVSSIKIDRSFVTPLDDPAAGSGLVRAVIEIGRALGMSTVAEGIETQVQLDRLRDLGCTFGQGYLLSRPLDSDAMRALISHPIDPHLGMVAAGRRPRNRKQPQAPKGLRLTPRRSPGRS